MLAEKLLQNKKKSIKAMKYFDSYDIVVFHHLWTMFKWCFFTWYLSHSIFLIQMQVPDNTEWIGTVWWWYYKYQDWWRIPDMFRVMYEHMTFLPCFGQSDYSYDYHQHSYKKDISMGYFAQKLCRCMSPSWKWAWLANSGITWAELGSRKKYEKLI